MERDKVESSNLRSVGYDVESQTLEVEFQSGSVYRYFEVPRKIYNGLMRAESIGGYFHKYVKNGGYRYQLVTDYED